jgi:hypothetical protein
VFFPIALSLTRKCFFPEHAGAIYKPNDACPSEGHRYSASQDPDALEFRHVCTTDTSNRIEVSVFYVFDDILFVDRVAV